MYIKELQADNFKSFANNVTIPFLKGFTAIAGPNGSGKSNIIDAILFALGLAKARNLRIEQISDFISNHTNKNEAYVRVVLAPENDDEEEIAVARRVKKSSQGYNSIYYLNDKVSTLSDIHLKLEKYRITPNSYNVVMQSDVMSITNCSNNERRTIIDEVAGVADFDRRIDKAKEELATVEDRVEKAGIALTEIDSIIVQLEKEKETALKYLKLKEEKQAEESRITTVKYFDAKRNLELAHQNILEAGKKQKEAEANVKRQDEIIEKLQAEYDSAEKEVKQNGEAEQLETKKKLEEKKGEIKIKELAIASCEKTVHNNKKTIENSLNGINEHNKKINELNELIKTKEKERENTENLKKDKEAELAKVLRDASGLNETADKQIAERNRLKKELEELNSKEWEIKNDSLPLEKDLSSLQKDIETAKKNLAELEDFKRDYDSNKDRLSVQITETEKEVNDFKLAQESILAKLDTNKNTIADVEHDMSTLHTKILTFEAQKRAREEIGLGKEIETVMNAKINGVHAPLSQLASVEEKYETALSIAAGGRMKNIVVDDLETAKNCIEYLKTARAGRATFLPLDKLHRAPSALKLPRERGVIDFAINLLDFDDIYTDAFFNALGDTVVVEDFECAKKLIGKYRTVTLDGSLFEKSGSVSGGEARKSGLKFGQTNNDELEKYKKGFAEFTKKYNDLKTENDSLNDRREKIRDGYSAAMTALSAARAELSNLNKNFAEYEAKKSENEKIIAEAAPKIKSIEAKLEKTEEKLVEINTQAAKLRDEIREIESKMSESELKKLKEMTAAIEKEIKDFEAKITKITNEISETYRSTDFNKVLINEKQEQIKRLEKDNEAEELNKQRFIGEKERLEEISKELEEKISKLGEKLVELQAKRDNAQKALMNAKLLKSNLEAELERIKEQIEAFKTRRKELEPVLEEAENELKTAGFDVKTLTPTDISIEEITEKIKRLQKRMEDMEPVNMLAIKSYDEVKARREEKNEQIETLTKEKQQILEKMSGYESVKKENFMKTYNNINANFKEIFSVLAEGEGTLLLENEENPFEGGLTIEAQPRDKKKQRLTGMSGGEKSLTALAFVFAIQKYLPAPFYALDEVDASLDGVNLMQLANTIKNQSKDTQFIVVSHNEDMLKLSDRILGVSQKEHGKTRVTGITMQG